MSAFILENGVLRSDPEAIPLRPKQRSRKWAPKKRTGCLTCRQRHVKCDEAKPACRRCVIASRDCIGPGYLGSSSMSAASAAAGGSLAQWRSSPLSLSSLVVHRQPNLTVSPAGVKTSEREMVQFYFFRKVAALSMAGVFDQKLCSQDMLQATSFHPTVWHASCALAAMYQREALAAAANVDDGPAKVGRAEVERHDLRVFALEQYNASIASVLEIMKIRDLSSLDLEVLLTTTLLFTAIASLQGDMPAAVVHVVNGQRIWQKWKRKNGGGDPLVKKRSTATTTVAQQQQQLSGGLLTPSSVAAVIGRLVSQSSTVRSAPWPQDYYTSLETPADMISEEPFRSPEDAYYEFEPLSTAYTELREKNKFLMDLSQRQPSFRVRCAYQAALAEWTAKFDKMRRGAAAGCHDDEEDEEEERGHSTNSSAAAVNEEAIFILQARQICMEIEVLRDPAGQESTWDEFTPRFAKIVSLGERLASELRRQEAGRVFSFSSSMMDVFFMTGTYCRDYEIRHRALRLLERHNAREGMCNSRLAFAIASGWAEIEEAPGEAKLKRAEEGTKGAGSSGDESEEDDCECEARVFICNDHRVINVAGEFHTGDVGTMTYWTNRAVAAGESGEFRSLAW